MPASLASARDTVLTEIPSRSAISAWFSRRPRFTIDLRALFCIFCTISQNLQRTNLHAKNCALAMPVHAGA
jgi:hypothetical protein